MSALKVSQIARDLNCSTAVVYKWLKRIDNTLTTKKHGITYVMPEGIERLKEALNKPTSDNCIRIENDTRDKALELLSQEL